MQDPFFSPFAPLNSYQRVLSFYSVLEIELQTLQNFNEIGQKSFFFRLIGLGALLPIVVPRVTRKQTRAPVRAQSQQFLSHFGIAYSTGSKFCIVEGYNHSSQSLCISTPTHRHSKIYIFLLHFKFHKHTCHTLDFKTIN